MIIRQYYNANILYAPGISQVKPSSPNPMHNSLTPQGIEWRHGCGTRKNVIVKIWSGLQLFVLPAVTLVMNQLRVQDKYTCPGHEAGSTK